MKKLAAILITGLICSAGTVRAQGDNSVVSHTPHGPPHQWTREAMLLAQPMPMSGEERKFVFSHKSVQRLHEWSYADFKGYASSPIGRRILFEEGNRWIDIRSMLKAQVEFAGDFLAGKSKSPKPLPDKPAPVETDTTGSDNQPGGISGMPGVSEPGASAGSPGEAGLGEPPSMNLKKNLSKEERFLKNQSDLEGTGSETIFSKLKNVRVDISRYCKQYDDLLKTARKEGKEQALENAMASVLWE